MDPLHPDWDPDNPEHSDALSLDYLRQLYGELAKPVDPGWEVVTYRVHQRPEDPVGPTLVTERHRPGCPTLIDHALRCRCEK